MLTLIVRATEVAGSPSASTTRIVNGAESPVVVGVPVMVTEFVALAPRDRPAGNVPLDTVHVNGGTPPDATTVALYAPLMVPEGSDVVVIIGGGSTVIWSVENSFVNATDVAFTLTGVAEATTAGAL